MKSNKYKIMEEIKSIDKLIEILKIVVNTKLLWSKDPELHIIANRYLDSVAVTLGLIGYYEEENQIKNGVKSIKF